ncbi:MAG TPA: histidine kinase dimerization/phosphoacceptor domain -containing protein [Puia sp.]|uniref:sensor histidine kinase n=1 Tax=Puia sp. TaxID=2045100 RepID=UPI002B97F8D9|nr:histidine kinase dimerization/phosphoacceptor domain -containing protein [Puia sp.]HVU95253.1 histidine kinase dimerization/phosphoacceptor domain -containing protein [Puia sp.]
MKIPPILFILGLTALAVHGQSPPGPPSHPPSPDNTQGRYPTSFEFHRPILRGRMATAKTYAAFVERLLTVKEKKEVVRLAVQYFQAVRRSGDIVAENIFVNTLSDLAPIDTTLVPLTTLMVDRLVADNDSLLPQLPAIAQRGAINQFAETITNFIYAQRPDLVIRYESIAIRQNQRLRQHATFPYQNLSFFYVIQGKTKEALALGIDAMRVAETPAGPVDGVGYETVARAWFSTGDLEKCLENTGKALALYFQNPLALEYPGALVFRNVRILLQQQKPAEALRLLRSVNTPSLSSQVNDGDRAFFAVSTAEVFHALGQNDSAERYYKKMFTLLPRLPFVTPYQKVVPYLSLATFYTETHRYARAGVLLDTLLSPRLKGVTAASYLENCWLLRYQVDSARRDYIGAVAALRQYQLLHDSLTNYRLNKEVADLGIRAETEKKNQHITDLEKQNALQARLQQATEKQDRIVRNSLIAGAALLALLAAGLYNRWQTRRRMSLRLEKISIRQQKLLGEKEHLLGEKERLLGEKEWLLREIHHRVKNNLQIIISLLNMQAGELKDEIAVSAFHEIGARVNTISLVHKKLYQEGQDMTTIDMQEYIRELVGFLRESLAARHKIVFDLDIQQLVLDVSQCIPLGLILNEAITNAIKYAFPGGSAVSPTICISLKEAPESCITLQIADNGVGLPAGFDAAGSKSLGLQLIHTLSLQLEGELVIANLPGRRLYPTTDPGAAGSHGLLIRLCFPWLEPMTKNNARADNYPVSRN